VEDVVVDINNNGTRTRVGGAGNGRVTGIEIEIAIPMTGEAGNEGLRMKAPPMELEGKSLNPINIKPLRPNVTNNCFSEHPN